MDIRININQACVFTVLPLVSNLIIFYEQSVYKVRDNGKYMHVLDVTST